MRNRIRSLALRTTIPFETFYFVILLSVALFAPAIGVQFITGSLVNAALFLSIYLVGVHGAVLLATVPSLLALGGGFLPAVLAPMVPFIVMANLVLIFVFNAFRNRLLLAVMLASFLKFSFLFFTSYLVMKIILKSGPAMLAIGMMGWTQLLTALTGGFIAVAVIRTIKGERLL